jgi:hypothetical protein
MLSFPDRKTAKKSERFYMLDPSWFHRLVFIRTRTLSRSLKVSRSSPVRLKTEGMWKHVSGY